jgi:hypothetical protein
MKKILLLFICIAFIAGGVYKLHHLIGQEPFGMLNRDATGYDIGKALGKWTNAIGYVFLCSFFIYKTISLFLSKQA